MKKQKFDENSGHKLEILFLITNRLLIIINTDIFN